jgi:hypothetical protein
METPFEQHFDSHYEKRLDERVTRFSQHILHEIGLRFDEVNARFDSIDASLKLQAEMLQSGLTAAARFTEPRP